MANSLHDPRKYRAIPAIWLVLTAIVTLVWISALVSAALRVADWLLS